jgi:hypothetical protein
MLLTQGNYKSILKHRIEKYGSIEPVMEEKAIAMKITSPNGQSEKLIKQEIRSKTQEMTK